MGQALYRKYRSKKFSEIVGQQHITTALDNAIASGRVSHAYLFTGPRGTGKTSVARILAHQINNLPYSDETNHLDIIEIDAASNRRIDEIRELRDKVHIAPSNAKYKVYIIDEVHMLTKEAFNALLKTLEEPPSHVVFILATTEVHKLPETIISRTQRFTFKPVDLEQVVEHLGFIAKEEGITISPDALKLLAEHGGGSFRDSISLLDQASNTGKSIELADVQALLGIAPQTAIVNMVQTLSSGAPAELHSQLEALKIQGVSAVHVAKQLSGILRQGLISNKLPLPAATVTRLMEKLLGVPSASDPMTQLEIILYGVILEHSGPTVTAAPPREPKAAMAAPIETIAAKPAALRQEIKTEAAQPPAAKAPLAKEKKDEKDEIINLTAPPQGMPRGHTQPGMPPAPGQPVQPAEVPVPAVPGNAALAEVWPLALAEIKHTQNTLYSVLRLAQPSWDGNTLLLTCRFGFHQKRILDSKNSRSIIECVKRLSGQDIRLLCEVDGELHHNPPPSAATTVTAVTETAASELNPEAASLDALTNVFGGVEILES